MVLAGPTAAAGPAGRAVRSGGEAPWSGATLLPFPSAGLAGLAATCVAQIDTQVTDSLLDL